MTIPLAERLRPSDLKNYIGQEHIVGVHGPVKLALDANLLPSMIFWGPPGVGKTTLARIIANESKRPFFQLSAINSGVKDIREVIEKAEEKNLFNGKSPVLFIDEIHRFSKSQQDSLLGAVERGSVTLIGATTENPSFEVISALLSRCQLYTLRPLEKEQLIKILEQAIQKDEWLNRKTIQLKEVKSLLMLSGGDARKLLNLFEIVVNATGGDEVTITDDMVERVAQQNVARYDKDGEMHYDVISAFIKAIRGSDPNAAVYWLARMIEGGEDPLFIARRLIILASEDIGNANPTALVIANNCFQAVSVIGMPEGRIVLAQAATYLASSAKSNAAYRSINEAQQLVRKTGSLPVPLHIRNAPTKLMKELGYGENYQYSHSYEGNFSIQEYLPDEIKNTLLYDPGNNPRENEMREFLKKLWKGKYGEY